MVALGRINCKNNNQQGHPAMKAVRTLLAALTFSFAGLAMMPGSARADDYCREYTRTVTVGGYSQEAYGTACYEPDGSWRIVGDQPTTARGAPLPSNAQVVYIINDGPRRIYQPRVRYVTYRPAYSQPRYYQPTYVYQRDRYNRRDWDRHDNRRWDRNRNGHDNRHDHNDRRR